MISLAIEDRAGQKGVGVGAREGVVPRGQLLSRGLQILEELPVNGLLSVEAWRVLRVEMTRFDRVDELLKLQGVSDSVERPDKAVLVARLLIIACGHSPGGVDVDLRGIGHDEDGRDAVVPQAAVPQTRVRVVDGPNLFQVDGWRPVDADDAAKPQRAPGATHCVRVGERPGRAVQVRDGPEKVRRLPVGKIKLRNELRACGRRHGRPPGPRRGSQMRRPVPLPSLQLSNLTVAGRLRQEGI